MNLKALKAASLALAFLMAAPALASDTGSRSDREERLEHKQAKKKEDSKQSAADSASLLLPKPSALDPKEDSFVHDGFLHETKTDRTASEGESFNSLTDFNHETKTDRFANGERLTRAERRRIRRRQSRLGSHIFLHSLYGK